MVTQNLDLAAGSSNEGRILSKTDIYAKVGIKLSLDTPGDEDKVWRRLDTDGKDMGISKGEKGENI